MVVYNTLTRCKEELRTVKPGEVRMYSCGPTVYNYAHIGNLRAYIFMDVLRRTLSYEGYKITGVMNITDVGHLVSDADEGEDKMVKAAREQKSSPWEIARHYTQAFMADIALLNIASPEIIARATEHIPEMIAFVQGLMDKGYGYETDDGIYFDIGKFPDYGKLSGIDLDEQIAGARVEVNEQKRHPADFTLWIKAPKEHIMQWPSPWGMGYPGWHIECSAMGRKYLGDEFDIHTGGVDHIPVHHENEIAQSEALVGHRVVNCWMHNEFMMVDNGKMSKSLGNTYTIADLAKRGIEPLAYRYFCLNAHYRNKLNFTWEGITAAQTAYGRLKETVNAHREGSAIIEKEKIADYTARFNEAIEDDLNIPKALGVLWTMLRNEAASAQVYDAAIEMDKVFGLSLDKAEVKTQEEIPAEIAEIAAQRAQARADKNWALADELRKKIAEKGYEIEDGPSGAKVKKK